MNKAIQTTLSTDDDTLNRAISFCMALLARREYSQSELRYKLKNQGFHNHAITDCLTHLSHNNYQSDTRFTEMFVRTRIRQRYGAKKIHYELTQRGIDEDLATNALTIYHDELIDNAQQLIIRKAPRGELSAIFSDWKLKSKITRFLVSKGYDYDTISLAFEKLQSEQ